MATIPTGIRRRRGMSGLSRSSGLPVEIGKVFSSWIRQKSRSGSGRQNPKREKQSKKQLRRPSLGASLFLKRPLLRKKQLARGKRVRLKRRAKRLQRAKLGRKIISRKALGVVARTSFLGANNACSPYGAIGAALARLPRQRQLLAIVENHVEPLRPHMRPSSSSTRTRMPHSDCMGRSSQGASRSG